LARGFYRDAGLDVRIVPGGPGTYPVQDLALGKVQFALAASDEVIMDVAQSMPLAIVGSFLQHYPEALLVHAESPVRSFADLGGTTVIAVPGTGWVTHVQKKYGIRFNQVPMTFEISRFLADRTVIQQCYITNEPYYVKKTGVKARTLLISDSGYDPYRVIIVNRSFLRARPDVVRAFVAASLRGWQDFAYGDPAPAIAAILRLNAQTTREFVEQSAAILRTGAFIKGDPAQGERVGAMKAGRLAGQIAMMADLRLIGARYPVDRLASFDFDPAGLPPPEISAASSTRPAVSPTPRS
jgi:NitT/TauT family transport system substrate-binding protein